MILFTINTTSVSLESLFWKVLWFNLSLVSVYRQIIRQPIFAISKRVSYNIQWVMIWTLSQENKTLYDLPPMSWSLQGLLKSSKFVINESLNLRSTKKSLEPTEYGWTDVDSCLIPMKEKLPYLTSILSYAVVVKDVKDGVIVLKMMFLALSFVDIVATVANYKCMLLIDSYIFFRLFMFNF